MLQSKLLATVWESKSAKCCALKANCSEFTLMFICFQKLQLTQNQKSNIKIRIQYRENALNPSYIRNTSDWLLKYSYDVIGLFAFPVKQKLYHEFAALTELARNYTKVEPWIETLFYVLQAIFLITYVLYLSRSSCSCSLWKCSLLFVLT